MYLSYTDRIKPTDCGIHTYLENLIQKNYQIPTFQRDVVWERDNVKKMWDSIYKFYPLGSILIWKTNIKLQDHRHIGGHVISDDFSRSEYNYILDGQQRTTSLLTSLYGGRIEGRDGFDPTIYVDLTVESTDEVDDDSYKKRFLFWDEIDDRGGQLKANIGKKNRFEEGLIVKLQDVRQQFGNLERNIQTSYPDYDHPYRVQLRRMREVLDNYRMACIELKGIQVSEVCQIFERINQAGKPLSIFDIVVAKTFRAEDNGNSGFYLRELFDAFREGSDGNYKHVDDITMLQMLAVLINRKFPDAGIHNISDRYLNDIKTEHIEKTWMEAKRAFLKVFDFFENYLHLSGPELIPFRYFYMTLASYFFENRNPDYEFLKKYFWFYSFHNDDLLSNTTHLWNHITFLGKEKAGEPVAFDRFVIDKQKLRGASYSSRGRLSRAILSLLANHEPRDWASPDRRVIADVYYHLTDKPNLHHIFPLNFVANNPGANRLDSNSLMNIAYITQITNLRISDKNPVQYLQGFDSPSFGYTLASHLVPSEILEWSRQEVMPPNALDLFIDARVDLILEAIQRRLRGTDMEVIDTMATTSHSSNLVAHTDTRGIL
jgi:hypothetical protein